MDKVITKLNVFPWDAFSDLYSFFKDVKKMYCSHGNYTEGK